MRSKNRTAVGNNCIRESVESDDMRNEELGEFGGVSGLRAGDEVTHLGHSINEHKDRIHAA